MADLRSQKLVEENTQQKLQEEIDSLKYRLAEAEAGKGRVEKKLKDQAEGSTDLTVLNQKIAELTAERDRLRTRLATVQQQLDNNRSDRS